MADQSVMVDVESLPRWKCHKIVHAAQIVAMTGAAATVFDPTATSTILSLKHGDADWNARVTDLWMQRHTPKVGGYLVIYDDGYTSFSPALAFEDGYAEIGIGR